MSVFNDLMKKGLVFYWTLYYINLPECEAPKVWKNDSLCHSPSCDSMAVDADCADTVLPACVCPADMFDKDGECVPLADCYTCVVDGTQKRVRSVLLICCF